MDRDSITRTGARAPGVERLGPLARRCLTRASALTQSREYTVKAVGTKDEGKPVVGQASSDIPALKPYWGKPAVRNFRGGDGNVGIIRSPVRAIALPDYKAQSRLEVASVPLNERSYEDSGVEPPASCLLLPKSYPSCGNGDYIRPIPSVHKARQRNCP